MPELPEVEIVRQSLDKKIKQKSIKKVIIRNKNLRFLFLIITFFTFFCIIFLCNDRLTISTSGNSGIYYYIKYIFFYATISSKEKRASTKCF